MDMELFWIAIMVMLILGAMAIGITVLVMRSRQQEQGAFPRYGNWRVEMWSVGSGYQLAIPFTNTCVLGRTTLFDYVTGGRWPEMDPTISREHCMLYEQNGMILVWNMSAINPASLNGHRLNQPIQLVPGDRLELGNSVFLVTRVECT